jgi:hypothetical protein
VRERWHAPHALKRYAVQLFDNGKFKLHEFKDKADIGVFLACLQLYRWKEKHGGHG